jgi:hypothetical protein
VNSGSGKASADGSGQEEGNVLSQVLSRGNHWQRQCQRRRRPLPSAVTSAANASPTRQLRWTRVLSPPVRRRPVADCVAGARVRRHPRGGPHDGSGLDIYELLLLPWRSRSSSAFAPVAGQVRSRGRAAGQRSDSGERLVRFPVRPVRVVGAPRLPEEAAAAVIAVHFVIEVRLVLAEEVDQGRGAAPHASSSDDDTPGSRSCPSGRACGPWRAVPTSSTPGLCADTTWPAGRRWALTG